MAKKLSSLLSLFYCQQQELFTGDHRLLKNTFGWGLDGKECSSPGYEHNTAQNKNRSAALSLSCCSATLNSHFSVALCSVCFSGPMHKHPVTYCMSHDLVFWLEARAFHKKKKSVCGSCDPVGISLHGEEPAGLTCLVSFHCQRLRCHNCCSFHRGPVSGNTAEFEAVPLNYLLIFQKCYTFFFC